MQLFYQPELINEIDHLDTDESRHAIKVLRLKIGSEINLIDGKGTFYKAEITDDNFRKCGFKVLEKRSEPKTSGIRHIALSPTKNLDRTEWFVEKAVEIGIDRISFVLCENSERRVLKTERLIKKAISAMKQSVKATLPQIDEMVPFKAFVKDQSVEGKFIAYVDMENSTHLKDQLLADNLVLVGPEGDFSNSEVELALELGFEKVSLGSSRLRTETAGIVVSHLMNL